VEGSRFPVPPDPTRVSDQVENQDNFLRERHVRGFNLKGRSFTRRSRWEIFEVTQGRSYELTPSGHNAVVHAVEVVDSGHVVDTRHYGATQLRKIVGRYSHIVEKSKE